MAHDEEPLLVDPPSAEAGYHVRDYERFTTLLNTVRCLPVILPSVCPDQAPAPSVLLPSPAVPVPCCGAARSCWCSRLVLFRLVPALLFVLG